MTAARQTSDEVAFFGYGSLVNEFTWTRAYAMEPAEVHGWTRQWKHCVDTPFGSVCALTVCPTHESAIQGIFIKCSERELAEVDEREIGYERVEISRDAVTVSGNLPDRLYIYRSLPRFYRRADSGYPLWLSYVEVVVSGYLRVFGEDGVDRFLNTTDCWDSPIVDDREKPLYPRAIQLAPRERRFVEGKLRAIKGVPIGEL